MTNIDLIKQSTIEFSKLKSGDTFYREGLPSCICMKISFPSSDDTYNYPTQGFVILETGMIFPVESSNDAKLGDYWANNTKAIQIDNPLDW